MKGYKLQEETISNNKIVKKVKKITLKCKHKAQNSL